MSVKVMKSAKDRVNSCGLGVYFLAVTGVVSVLKSGKEYVVKDGPNVTSFQDGELSYAKGVMTLRTNMGNYSWRVR